MTYNQKRHQQLLKRFQDLKNQRKSFYKEDPEEYLELSKYEGSIESYIYWKSRTLFLLLMEKFIHRIISGEEFRDSFLELRQKLIYECDNFSEDYQNEEFYDSIKKIYLKRFIFHLHQKIRPF